MESVRRHDEKFGWKRDVDSHRQRSPVSCWSPVSRNDVLTEATKDDFDRAEVPVSNLHPDFRKTGAGSCVIHALRLKYDAAKEFTLGKRKEKKEKKEKKKKKKTKR